MKVLIRSFPKLLLLIIGGLVAVISLLSANRVLSQEETLPLTQQRLYFGGDILPDHILYPVIMAFDQAKLQLANEQEQAVLHRDYAWRRLEYTEGLLTRGYQSLSFSTFTKAYKYYGQALLQAQDAALSQSAQSVLAEDALLFQFQSRKLFAGFTDTQQQELQRLDSQITDLRQFFIDSI